ncbi:hypothetical protein LR69_01352 [Geobacillus sp. BCO2]|nr:hypothetical protein LR69_01352 [Geobacillus sp. BCO2]
MNQFAHHQGIHKFFSTLGLTLQLSKPVIKHLHSYRRCLDHQGILRNID